MVNQNEMEKIVAPMLENVCDKLCRWPWEITDQEEMSWICHECELEKYAVPTPYQPVEQMKLEN